MRVDTRAGSKDLIDPLRLAGVPVEPAFLVSGDVEIIGNGPEGLIMVGVEYKKLGDLFQSMRNGRIVDQFRLMQQAYSVRWLLIEGRVQGVKRGQPVHTQTKGKRWRKADGHITYQEIVSRTLSYAQAMGVMPWWTENPEQSVEWLRVLNLWWTSDEWAKHRSCLDFYRPEAIGGNPLEQPPLRHKMAMGLPGLGTTKAVRAAAHFDNTRQMMNATPEEWVKIEGVGKKIAETIDHKLETE